MFTIKSTKTNERSGGEKESNRRVFIREEAQIKETIESLQKRQEDLKSNTS